MSVRLSVVTATLNRCAHLERAIQSVIAQGLDDVEHIVIDGRSTDGTMEMLKRYPHLVVKSEADSGLYEAWNKGIRCASGDVICILNSDDEIPIGAFARVREAFAATPHADLVSGAVELLEINEAGVAQASTIDAAPILALREQDIGPGIPITNGRYLSRLLLQRVGFFDERYRLVSDRDYLLRVLMTKPVNVCVEATLYRYLIHRGSLTLAGQKRNRLLADECLKASRNGVREASSVRLRAAYMRWHAWSVFYLTGIDIREGHFATASATVLQGLLIDPFWPARVPVPVVRHYRERRIRAGRPVNAH